MPEDQLTKSDLLDVDVVVEAPGWKRLAGDADIAAAARLAFVRGRRQPGKSPLPHSNVAIALSSDAKVRKLNHQFRGFDKPTNVLSFPAGPTGSGSGPSHLGDIVLARETVEREAGDLGIEVAAHTMHLVIHGILHLLGYDHDSTGSADRMEALETACLAELGIADPYAGRELADEAGSPILEKP